MEGDIVTLQDAFVFDYSAGVDANGRFLGKPVPTGVRPRFTDRFDELGIQLSPARVRGIAHRRCAGKGAVTVPATPAFSWWRWYCCTSRIFLVFGVALRPNSGIPLSRRRPDVPTQTSSLTRLTDQAVGALNKGLRKRGPACLPRSGWTNAGSRRNRATT